MDGNTSSVSRRDDWSLFAFILPNDGKLVGAVSTTITPFSASLILLRTVKFLDKKSVFISFYGTFPATFSFGLCRRLPPSFSSFHDSLFGSCIVDFPPIYFAFDKSRLCFESIIYLLTCELDCLNNFKLSWFGSLGSLWICSGGTALLVLGGAGTVGGGGIFGIWCTGSGGIGLFGFGGAGSFERSFGKYGSGSFLLSVSGTVSWTCCAPAYSFIFDKGGSGGHTFGGGMADGGFGGGFFGALALRAAGKGGGFRIAVCGP